jgi:hypothetical protein
MSREPLNRSEWWINFLIWSYIFVGTAAVALGVVFLMLLGVIELLVALFGGLV